MKTVKFYVAPPVGDTLVYSAADLTRLSITPEALEAQYGDRGGWLILHLKDATGRLERAINAKTRIADELAGWRQDPDLKPAARFEVLVDSWEFPASWSSDRWPREITMATFEELHPNVVASIDEALRLHLRPAAVADADFLALSRPLWDPSSPAS